MVSIGSVGSGDGGGSWRFLRARRSHQRPKAAAIVAVVSAIGCGIGIAWAAQIGFGVKRVAGGLPEVGRGGGTLNS